jgi:hypothetical protein
MAEILDDTKLPQELQTILYELVRQYEDEDGWIRKQQIKLWKRNHEFWHGIQYIFWSESRQDWMVPTDARWLQTEEGREESEGPFYDFVINIYRAHGESIIAALSSQVPSVRFIPDDIDDEDDLLASQTYDKISDLIQRHNPSKKILMQHLFYLWNDGIDFTYSAPKTDKAFGMLYVPHFDNGQVCPECNFSQVPDQGQQMDPMATCPQCAQGDPTQQIPPNQVPMQQQPVMTGYDAQPKTRVLMENYGALFVKVPYYAKDAESIGYLFCTIDQPLAFLKSIFPNVADKLDASETDLGQYEKLGRAPSSFSIYSQINENRQVRPLKRCWLRPWVFDGLGKDKEAERDQLKALFPDGCRVTFVGRTFVEATNECLDEYWTIGQAGLSQYIHSDPLGQPLLPIQEMRNTLANLTLETIEHAIPSEYADPGVLDFENFSRHEARPGLVFPAKPLPGQPLGNSFYTSERATLSKEVPAFAEQLDADGQFVTGAFPSIYGGPGEGSNTLGEYQQSRAMALQRLSIAWNLTTLWWAEVMKKSVKLYIDNLVQDEKYTVKKNGTYESVYISMMQAQGGKVGDVEVEGSDQFPISLAQKQAILLKLLEFKDPELNQAILDPENRKNIASVLAWPDLFIPGEAQRIKQARETQLMLKNAQPIPIDPEVDDHEIHIEALINTMVGPIGLDTKRTNPQVWQAWLEHLMMHKQAIPPPQPEPVKAGVNLSLKGQDLGDPAVQAALNTTGIVPPGVQVEAVPVPQKLPGQAPGQKNGVSSNVSET